MIFPPFFTIITSTMKTCTIYQIGNIRVEIYTHWIEIELMGAKGQSSTPFALLLLHRVSLLF